MAGKRQVKTCFSQDVLSIHTSRIHLSTHPTLIHPSIHLPIEPFIQNMVDVREGLRWGTLAQKPQGSTADTVRTQRLCHWVVLTRVQGSISLCVHSVSFPLHREGAGVTSCSVLTHADPPYAVKCEHVLNPPSRVACFQQHCLFCLPLAEVWYANWLA